MTYHVDKEPVFCVDSVLVKEECSANEALGKEVGSERREPFESVETSAGFKHKESNRLLKKQTNDNGPPLDSRPVPRRRPKAELKHDETHDRDSAISIFRALRRRISKWSRTRGTVAHVPLRA
jgi:hypothetical protein